MFVADAHAALPESSVQIFAYISYELAERPSRESNKLHGMVQRIIIKHADKGGFVELLSGHVSNKRRPVSHRQIRATIRRPSYEPLRRLSHLHGFP